MGRFASSGVVVGQTRRDRRDQRADQLKGNKVTMGKNVPRQAEGAVGDITVRDVSVLGLRCYIKTDSGWFDINTLGSANEVEWIPMVLSGSWVTDATYPEVPKYFKDTTGFVHFRGKIQTSGSDTANITTLPPGFRPPEEIWRFIAMLTRPSTTSHIGCVKITTSGTILATAGGLANAALMDLEGISYYASQEVRGYGGGSSSGSGTGDGSAGGNVTH